MIATALHPAELSLHELRAHPDPLRAVRWLLEEGILLRLEDPEGYQAALSALAPKALQQARLSFSLRDLQRFALESAGHVVSIYEANHAGDGRLRVALRAGLRRLAGVATEDEMREARAGATQAESKPSGLTTRRAGPPPARFTPRACNLAAGALKLALLAVEKDGRLSREACHEAASQAASARAMDAVEHAPRELPDTSRRSLWNESFRAEQRWQVAQLLCA